MSAFGGIESLEHIRIWEGVTVQADPQDVIARVLAPRVEVEEVPVVAEGEGAEGEGEGAEGESASEGDSGGDAES